MRYFNELLGILREGGFSYDLAHHALHALGSRALGFTQELFKPDGDTDEEADMAMLEQMADQLPYIVGMMMEVSHDADDDSSLGWCDDQAEFEFGLDLRARSHPRRSRKARRSRLTPIGFVPSEALNDAYRVSRPE